MLIRKIKLSFSLVLRMSQGYFRGVLGVSEVSQGCLKGVLRMSQDCSKGSPRVLKRWFESFSMVFQGCFKNASWMFQRDCRAGVNKGRSKHFLRKLKGCVRSILWLLQVDVSRKLQRSFKQVPKWVQEGF